LDTLSYMYCCGLIHNEGQSSYFLLSSCKHNSVPSEQFFVKSQLKTLNYWPYSVHSDPLPQRHAYPPAGTKLMFTKLRNF